MPIIAIPVEYQRLFESSPAGCIVSLGAYSLEKELREVGHPTPGLKARRKITAEEEAEVNKRRRERILNFRKAWGSDRVSCL